MERRISRRVTAIATGATIAIGGLLMAGGPASATARPTGATTAAVAHAMPSSEHTYGEDYQSGWATDAGRSQYSDGYSWYRLDYGLFYRWDGADWVAQTADDAGFLNSLNYRYDEGHFSHWDGTQWAPGTGRPDDIAQGLGLNPDPQAAEQA